MARIGSGLGNGENERKGEMVCLYTLSFLSLKFNITSRPSIPAPSSTSPAGFNSSVPCLRLPVLTLLSAASSLSLTDQNEAYRIANLLKLTSLLEAGIVESWRLLELAILPATPKTGNED